MAQKQANKHGKTLRSKLDTLHNELDTERSSFMSHWRDLGDHVHPRRYQALTTDTNRGEKKNQKIIDGTATLSSRTLSSGMMSGITSPARAWFRLQTSNAELNEIGNVKTWLHETTKRMRDVLLKSNIYRTLPLIYKDIGTFGTAAMLIEEDFDSVLHTRSFPVGSYMIANDRKLRVRVFMREFRMTIRQIAEEFGKIDENGKLVGENISDHVKSLYNEDSKEAWVDVIHAIIPNPDHNPNRMESRFKPFLSATYETGRTSSRKHASPAEDQDTFLRLAGFNRFPILAVRWEVSGEDVYATSCPGMEGLGDIRQLQVGVKRLAQAIEKMVNPPMVAPASLRTARTSLLAGDITYSDEREGQKGFRPAHEINPKIAELNLMLNELRTRIRRAWFEDLFLMLAQSDRRQITAREIEERHEEKLLALGPVLEQLNQDLLDPIIDLVFDYMDRQNLLPEIPKELQGVELKVEYISIMAQAQKLAGVSIIERFAGFVGGVAQGVGPEAIDKVNIDKLIDEYGDITSVPPGIIRTDDEVAALRSERAQAAQAQATAEAIPGAASAAKDLSETDVEKDSALRRVLQVSGGQGIPGA